MEKREVHLVQNEGTVPEPVSTVSKDEEAHLLELADTALHNESGSPSEVRAGDFTRQQHERLKKELQDTVERLETPRSAA